MKIFKIMMIVLIVLFAFTSCEKFTCNDSHPMAELAGTWTCFQNGYAEALVIKTDGSVISTGYDGVDYWENVKGNIAINEGKITMTFEDNDNTEGHFDFIPGIAFSISSDKGERIIYNYCKEDLSDKIIGMWVCTYGPNMVTDDMSIQTYTNNGKFISTTSTLSPEGDTILNKEERYVVIGDLLIFKFSEEILGPKYIVNRLFYAPNGTLLGDIMTQKMCLETELGLVETSTSWLRVNQSLDLANKKYDHIKTFISNVKGLDKDIDITGTTFNFAKMTGEKLNKMLKTLLFAVDFPNANTIRYNYFYNGKNNSLEAPIVVDGNKMTVQMSKKNALFKDIDLYTYQDADASQMHMYLPTYAFINFFGNMQAYLMAQNGLLDLTDATAVNSIFDSIDNAVDTINLSLVMEKAN